MFIYKTVSQFFEILILSLDIWGTFISPWNQPYFLRNSNKSLLSSEQNIKRNLRKTTEGNNAKINFSPNASCTFLLFKASPFLQIFFLRKSKFWERQIFSIVNFSHSFTYESIYFSNSTKEHILKTSNKRTYISLLINLFI